MIDPKDLTQADVGRLVRFTRGTVKTLTGTLSGWNEDWVFVRYGGSITGLPTSPEDLEFLTGFRLAFRGYKYGAKVFEEFETVPLDEIDAVIPRLGKKHATALADADLHMIEIEFLDEPDPNERFARFGTDPSGMVNPVAINL